MTTNQIKKLSKRVEDLNRVGEKLIVSIVHSTISNNSRLCALYNNVTFRKSHLILKYKYYSGII